MALKAILLLAFFVATFHLDNTVGELKVLLLHNNDMHARFDEIGSKDGICKSKDTCYGGFARIIQAVKEIKKDQAGKRNVIFLNAGDTFQGSPYFTIFGWPIVADLIDYLKFDVMSLGNHEFDSGVENLGKFLNSISTPVVAANVDLSEVPALRSPTLTPHKILTVNGVKIAVIGYITGYSKVISKTGLVKFYDEIESINHEIQFLKNTTDIKIFIALGHSGFDVDLKIAKEVPDIDLVVGGHTNTFLYNGKPPANEIPQGSYPEKVKQSSGKIVPVVQAYAFTKYLGYLELDFNDDGDLIKFSGNPILLDEKHKQDKEFIKALKPWKEKISNMTSTVLGNTKVLLDAQDYVCKLQECNLGNAIADAMIEANVALYEGEGWTDAPVAIFQGGGIRSSIDASQRGGNITYGDVMSVIPTEDVIAKGTIRGSHLLEAFTHAVQRYERTKSEQVGEFLQVSGIRVEYTVSNEPASRVTKLRVRCGDCVVPSYSDLDENKNYTILLPVYLVNGGDNYTVFVEHLHNVENLPSNVTKAFAEYIRARSPIYPTISNRITVIGGEPQTTSSTLQTTAQTSTTKGSGVDRLTSTVTLISLTIIAVLKLPKIFFNIDIF